MGVEALDILMVEDDPDHADVVQGMLGATGVQLAVRLETTVRGALAAIAARSPDLLLLDLHLPDAQGAEAVRVVMNAAPTVPVVVLTASNDEKVHLRAKRTGAENVLGKVGLEPRALRRDLLFALERGRARAGLPSLPDSVAGTELVQGVVRTFDDGLAELGRNRLQVRSELAQLEKVFAALSADDAAAAVLEEHDVQGVMEGLQAILEDDAITLGRVRHILSGLDALAGFEDLEPVDLSTLMDRVCDQMSSEVERRAVLVADIDEDLVVVGSSSKLTLALEHLIANAALSFTGGSPTENTVSITAEEEGHGVVIEVWDNGRPLPEGLEIARPFVSGWGRLGLGLTLAIEIVQRHGGVLDWSSNPEGTTFRVVLPVAP